MNAHSATATGMDEVRTWKSAHDDLDSELSHVLGLAEVLYEVATEYRGLCNPDPMANGILSLIKSIRAGLGQIDSYHREEWNLQRQAAASSTAGS